MEEGTEAKDPSTNEYQSENKNQHKVEEKNINQNPILVNIRTPTGILHCMNCIKQKQQAIQRKHLTFHPSFMGPTCFL